MNQPLDFSSGARRTPPATPPTSKGKRPGARRLLIILAAIALVGAAAFVAVKVLDVGGDSDDDALTLARYCQLATQLDQVSMATGAASAPGIYDGTPDEIKAALDQMGATTAELRSTAPGDVKGDIRSIVDALERAASGDSGVARSASFTEATKRLRSQRDANCSTGAGSGDG
jgi:hypothetical protein